MNIFCIEQNYFTNKRERENYVFSAPDIFIKPSSALLSGTEFNYPGFEDNRLYAQSELVLRVSKNGKNISESEAINYYDSVTTGINFIQMDIHDVLNGIIVPWEKVHAWSNSSVIGEWFPASSIANILEVNFCLYNNREMVQLGHSELMIHDFHSLISIISKSYELMEGDIIFTGTPIGIGEVFRGDKLEAFFEDDTAVELEVNG
ncbi:MAG: fumarylacetoacetate hydrolase family protein [Ginsengibacter sp.]|jgi:2-keto-4-pentenoate hydratase/2-oxohepta-3-ene-1,7-dioic acid hydratase in catechol pathway